jgi:hypothetical protein
VAQVVIQGSVPAALAAPLDIAVARASIPPASRNLEYLVILTPADIAEAVCAQWSLPEVMAFHSLLDETV